MARRRRDTNVFGLAFLDAMTCGLGAVVLLYMVINASVGLRAEAVTVDLSGAVTKLETEVLEGHRTLEERRKILRELQRKHLLAKGLSLRMIEALEKLQVQLATFDNENLSKKDHLNKLKSDLKSLEEEAKRLAADVPEDDTPGDNIRAFLGHGDRQYLTGLKLGGKRILVLLDTSSSMFAETIVDIVRYRNLPDEQKIRAKKWQRAVATADWITTQLPRDGTFQIYTFGESARPLLDGTDGEWLASDDRKILNDSIDALRTVVPAGGTSLYHAFASIKKMRPPPDNVILLTDGLPTRGSKPSTKRKVSAETRLDLFRRAANTIPNRMPINVILFPMEGDPMAASAFWRLTIQTRGSFMSPAKDWP